MKSAANQRENPCESVNRGKINPFRLSLPDRISPAQSFMRALQDGATFNAALSCSGLPRDHAELLLEHLRRTGLLHEGANRAWRGSTCCDAGACTTGTKQSLSPSQLLHCRGCPLSKL